jgi:hypothetical protein
MFQISARAVLAAFALLVSGACGGANAACELVRQDVCDGGWTPPLSLGGPVHVCKHWKAASINPCALEAAPRRAVLPARDANIRRRVGQ